MLAHNSAPAGYREWPAGCYSRRLAMPMYGTPTPIFKKSPVPLLLAISSPFALFVCLMIYVAHNKGYDKAIAELDKQPRIWRCVLDPRDIASGVPFEVMLPATRPEIALRTARERAQWGDRRAYVQAATENYPEILGMRISP
jgi:hypothetical protein